MTVSGMMWLLKTSHAGRMIMERFFRRREDRIAGQRVERRDGAQDHVK